LRINDNDLRNLIKRSLIESYRKSGLLLEGKGKLIDQLGDLASAQRSLSRAIEAQLDAAQAAGRAVNDSRAGLNAVTDGASLSDEVTEIILKGEGGADAGADVIRAVDEVVESGELTTGRVRRALTVMWRNKFKTLVAAGTLPTIFGAVNGWDGMTAAEDDCGGKCKMAAAVTDTFSEMVAGVIDEIGGSDIVATGLSYGLPPSQGVGSAWPEAVIEAADSSMFVDLREMNSDEANALKTALSTGTPTLYGLSMDMVGSDSGNFMQSWSQTIDEIEQNDAEEGVSETVRWIANKINSMPLFELRITDEGQTTTVSVFNWGEDWADASAAVAAQGFQGDYTWDIAGSGENEGETGQGGEATTIRSTINEIASSGKIAIAQALGMATDSRASQMKSTWMERSRNIQSQICTVQRMSERNILGIDDCSNLDVSRKFGQFIICVEQLIVLTGDEFEDSPYNTPLQGFVGTLSGSTIYEKVKTFICRFMNGDAQGCR
jgi:hypothetical protein